MERRNETLIKLAQTGLMAALCFVAFAFLKINIPLPGGDATALHVGNAFCVLAALILGGWYGGLAGAIGMGIADVIDPVYITGAPKTFVLKLCIGLIVGLVAHRIARINESTDKRYVFRWSVIASVAGLGFNVIAADGRGSGKMEHGIYFCQCSCLCSPCRSVIQCTQASAYENGNDPFRKNKNCLKQIYKVFDDFSLVQWYDRFSTAIV